jgi:hypothetical protein
MTGFELRTRWTMLTHRLEHPQYRLIRYVRRGATAIYTVACLHSGPARIRTKQGRLLRMVDDEGDVRIDRKLRIETLSQMEVLPPGDLSGLFRGLDSSWSVSVKIR